MRISRRKFRSVVRYVLWGVLAGMVMCSVHPALAGDLAEVRERGVLRHLGIAYANFVTGSGDGLDVELAQLFARHIGVKYEFVPTTWEEVFGDLTGSRVRGQGDKIEVLGEVPVRGDVVASGLTILPWREKIVDYSTPTFPTQVWLVARADSAFQPIQPSGDLDRDIASVKSLLEGRTVLGKGGTCLDPALYRLADARPKEIHLFKGGLNELAPAVINGDADATLLDVPDSLVALQKWPGQIKIVGPLSERQEMAFAFAKASPRLREAFDRFFEQCKKDGTYLRLVEKYYADVFHYYPEFFE